LGEIVLDLAKVDADLDSGLRRLDDVRRGVEAGEERGEPFIKGSKIPVYLVAALAREQSAAEIVEDFPSLSRDQVEAAIEYAKAYPKRGRPYPARSLKRALTELADLGAFDEEIETTDVAPRRIP